MAELNVQPQGYSSTDEISPPLPSDSPKLQQWMDLKAKLGLQLQVRTFVGYAPEAHYSDVRGKLVDVLLVPTSPPVYRWLHDEMWTVKVRLQKDDGSVSELVIDQTTQLRGQHGRLLLHHAGADGPDRRDNGLPGRRQ